MENELKRQEEAEKAFNEQIEEFEVKEKSVVENEKLLVEWQCQNARQSSFYIYNANSYSKNNLKRAVY